MRYTHFQPHPALQQYIESICILHIDFKANSTLSPFYTFVPSHTRFLCFYLHDQLKVKKQDGDFDTRLVMGREIDDLLDRLMEAKSDGEKNNITQDYLLGKLHQLKPALPFDMVMAQLVCAGGNLSVDTVASRSCMSIRQFERKCRERIGLSPKLYARMIRFSHAYKFKESSPQTSWNAIAHHCGYFDQMHFIRDFKSFAGFTPSMLNEEDVKRSVRFRTLEDLSISFPS